MERCPYWIFAAARSAPGEPRMPMFDYMFLPAAYGFRYACEKLSVPTTYGADQRTWRGYELVRVTLTSDEDRKRREAGFREALRPLLENYDALYAKAKEEMIFAELPPANEHKDELFEDTVTGKRYRSNGTEWIEEK